MIKFKFFLDKDMEEDWINSYAQEGWRLKKFFMGFYTFEKYESEKYCYAIDLLESWTGDREQYEKFMSDMDIKVVCQWWRWVFLEKIASDKPFQLYSDNESITKYYMNIRKLFSFILVIEIVCLTIELISYANSKEPIILFFAILISAIIGALFRVIKKINRKIGTYSKDGII